MKLIHQDNADLIELTFIRDTTPISIIAFLLFFLIIYIAYFIALIEVLLEGIIPMIVFFGLFLLHLPFLPYLK